MKTGAALAILLAMTGIQACHSRDRQSFAAMQSRGQAVMGVDQYHSAHRFELLPDGGRIELQREVEDPAGVSQIRRHLSEIAKAFAAGQFDQPMLVHDAVVPGTGMMTARKHAITYDYQDLPKGGEVRITSHDSIAIAAIHDFLAFQRREHHAGM